MPSERKPRPVGINHVSIEVGNIAEAVQFYGRLMQIDVFDADDERADFSMGDQFLAFTLGRHQPDDVERHFGLVVDDRELFREALLAIGVEPLPGRFLSFVDPWGNRIEVVGYSNIKFTKAANVLRGMKMADLTKNDHAKTQLSNAGMEETG